MTSGLLHEFYFAGFGFLELHGDHDETQVDKEEGTSLENKRRTNTGLCSGMLGSVRTSVGLRRRKE